MSVNINYLYTLFPDCPEAIEEVEWIHRYLWESGAATMTSMNQGSGACEIHYDIDHATSAYVCFLSRGTNPSDWKIEIDVAKLHPLPKSIELQHDGYLTLSDISREGIEGQWDISIKLSHPC